jgi:cytochrome c oxidase cbb3-type subunit I/II
MDQQATKIEQNLYNTDSDLKDAFEADRQDALAKGEEFVEMKNREIVALIAYLQRLGTDINMENTEDASAQN